MFFLLIGSLSETDMYRSFLFWDEDNTRLPGKSRVTATALKDTPMTTLTSNTRGLDVCDTQSSVTILTSTIRG